MEMQTLLPLLWAGLLASGVMLYVIFDGFDLGVGILFPWGRDDHERDIMMNSIAPIWDGNETWLVLAGGGLLGAFPTAYAILMPALYIPIIFMLLALIFRGVAFEFRGKSERSRGVWDFAFTFGSAMAAFFQGVVLGAFIQGFQVSGMSFSGGVLDWLSPFSLMTGFALVCGYALLGACWLIIKTEGALQTWCYKAAQVLMFVVLGWIGLVSLWTPILYEAVAQRWFSLPNLLLLAPVPIITALISFMLWRSLRLRRQYTPFLLTVSLFGLGYSGIGISLWPYIIPRSLTLWDTAAQLSSQTFLLIGTLLLMPVILGYTAYNYWVLRGKVEPGERY